MSHKIKMLALDVVLVVTLVLFHSPMFTPQAQAQGIYQTIDKHGNVTFTDNPGHDAKQVHLPPLPRLPAMAPQQIAPQQIAPQQITPQQQTAPKPGQPFMPYDSFTINAPANNQTLPLGAAGNVQVLLNIQPELRKDHQVRLLLDGQVSQSAMHTTNFMLSNLNRGSHQLQAELLDASGIVRHRTPAQMIHVQRASVHLPQNPNNSNRHFTEPNN